MLLPTSSPPASRCLPNRYELQSSELRAPAGVSGPIVGALAHDEVDPQAPGLWRPQYLHLERDRWSFGRGEGRGSAGGESFKFEMRCEKKSCNEYGKLLDDIGRIDFNSRPLRCLDGAQRPGFLGGSLGGRGAQRKPPAFSPGSRSWKIRKPSNQLDPLAPKPRQTNQGTTPPWTN